MWGWEAGEIWSWEEWCKGREKKTMVLQMQERYQVTKGRTVLLTYFSLLNFWAYSGGRFRVVFAVLIQFLRVLLQIPVSVFAPGHTSPFTLCAPSDLTILQLQPQATPLQMLTIPSCLKHSLVCPVWAFLHLMINTCPFGHPTLWALSGARGQ